MIQSISVPTRRNEELIDVTSRVIDVINGSGISDGVVTCFVTHTTAGITINENADPSVVRDILFALERAVPDKGFKHAEGNSKAHVKSSMMGSSVQLILENGRLVLGTWQGIYFCEFDGPRNRKMMISVQ